MIDLEMISYKVILWFCVRMELQSRFSAHTLSCLAVDQSGWMARFHSFYQALMCTYSATENSPGGRQANVWELSGKKIAQFSGPGLSGSLGSTAQECSWNSSWKTSPPLAPLGISWHCEVLFCCLSLTCGQIYIKGFRSRCMFISSYLAGVL